MSSASLRIRPSIDFLRDKIERMGRIYIFPTKAGLYFLSFTFTLFLFSLIYGHSMAFTSTFLFISLFMMTAVVTNYNLYQVRIVGVKQADWAQAGEDIPIFVKLKSVKDCLNLKIRSESSTRGQKYSSKPFDLRHNELLSTTLYCPPLGRGVHTLNKLTLSTDYPAMLFQSWMSLKCDTQLVVLPRPMDKQRKYEVINRGEEQELFGENRRLNADEFYEHHLYHDRDSWKQIDWKVYARREELYKKVYESEDDRGLAYFDFDKIEGLDKESALSQFYFWIKEAVDSGQPFIGKLSDHVISWRPIEGKDSKALKKLFFLIADY